MKSQMFGKHTIKVEENVYFIELSLRRVEDMKIKFSIRVLTAVRANDAD
jgi:hypothetical protein